MTARSVAGVAPGTMLPTLTIHLDRARLIEYAAASGDRNPIHWDERFAASVGLPDVIAHGMLTMGAAVEAVSSWAGGGRYVLDYGAKFIAPVPVPYDGGADIEVSGTVRSVDAHRRTATVDLAVSSGGRKILGRAQATVALR